MKPIARSVRPLRLAAVALALTAACTPGQAPAPEPAPTLPAFGTDEELTRFHRRLVAQEERRRKEMARRYEDMPVPMATVPPPAPPPPADAAPAAPDAAGAAAESITNVQHAGVDEGGIVKVHGDHLVILRRGRLFTVAIGDDQLRPVSAVDAFGPGIDPGGTWYDEMLISGDVVMVIGYSYARGGTEVGLFTLDGDGGLRYRSTWHIRSNDYYSSRNYASRLVDGKLVFYSPLRLRLERGDLREQLPAVRRWAEGLRRGDQWETTVSPTRLYKPGRPLSAEDGIALHTVTVCDPAGGELSCQATAIVGQPGRVFYVSPRAVYVWATDWQGGSDGERARSMLYRMPLDGSPPSGVGVRGGPVDQFSFLESGDEHLNVLVRAEGGSEAMWSSEWTSGDLGLMRIPLRELGDGSRDVPREAYRPLPGPEASNLVNRYVGDHLLYGAGSGWGRPGSAGGTLHSVRWAGGDPAALELPHAVDRIEAMGGDAVVVGSDGRDLHFSAVRLGAAPEAAGRWAMEGASQGETRSHGFFYRPDGPARGVLGLPVRGPAEPGYRQLFSSSASIVFVRNDDLRFRPLGELEARAEGAVDDGCRASCVDWYGNARPIFLRGRVFALMGYEIVEGEAGAEAIRERRRVSFAPGPRGPEGR